MRRALTFVLGGLGGAALDRMHLRAGVLSYPSTTGQPWWVAPQFGVATLVMLAGARRFARPAAGTSAPRLATGAAWFVGSYAATCRLDERRARALTAALTACAAVRIARRQDRARTASFAVLLATLGTGYEHFLAGTGAFSYSRPELGNVPAWLAPLYLQGAPLAIDLASSLS